jgi:hypothetical protein
MILILRHETDGTILWSIRDPDDPTTWNELRAVLNTMGVTRVELIPEVL